MRAKLIFTVFASVAKSQLQPEFIPCTECTYRLRHNKKHTIFTPASNSELQGTAAIKYTHKNQLLLPLSILHGSSRLLRSKYTHTNELVLSLPILDNSSRLLRSEDVIFLAAEKHGARRASKQEADLYARSSGMITFSPLWCIPTSTPLQK